MKYLLTSILLLCSGLYSFGQYGNVPKLNLDDFTTDHQKIDTSAHAIVLFETGRTELEYIEADRNLMVVHTRTIRMKIFDKEGAGYANIEIPLYRYGNNFEYVREIKGHTYNHENGQINDAELGKSGIFNEKASDYLQITKFTLPNIKDNSIIEFSYKVYSPGVHNFRKWNFQSDIPKLYSEYIAVIPATFDYNVSLKGHLQLSDQKSELLSNYFLLGGVRNDCSKMTYILKDIPAFKEEAFMLAKVNYISAISFELKTYTDLGGIRKNFTRTWENIDTDLMNEKEFGGQIKNKSAFKEIVAPILSSHKNKLDQAKALYSYLQKNIVWNGVGGKYAELGVKKALDQKKGNIADINLALVAGMNAADIEAYPVIIATRNAGIPSYLYPVVSDFNSVICMVKIDGKQYLLDASDKFLPFGQLSLNSINDRGRAIYSRGNSEWIELVNDVPSSITYNILGKVEPDGKIKGSIRTQTSGLRAYFQRAKISDFASLEEYEENLMEKTSTIRILKSKLENLDSLDNDLIETIDFELDLKNNMTENRLVFNPIFLDRTTKNPFLLDERNYHVDLGATLIENYNINIMLPEGFELTSGPKNNAMALPENTAKYIYRSVFENNSIMVQQSTRLNKAIYNPEEYFHLKEFFARIISQQQVDFQFQKK